MKGFYQLTVFTKTSMIECNHLNLSRKKQKGKLITRVFTTLNNTRFFHEKVNECLFRFHENYTVMEIFHEFFAFVKKFFLDRWLPIDTIQ